MNDHPHPFENDPPSIATPSHANDLPAFDDTDTNATRKPNAADVLAPRSGMIAGYEILAELGRGGMGVVYRARQTHLQREVALKMILSGGHAGAEDRLRFLAEAEAVAAIQHPGIVQVFDFGTHEGLPYFALEYCPGGSLADRLKATPLPPREAAHVVEQVARAMQAAHEKGIVHRDLKPANVLLAADGAPRVTDFGLAKRVEAGSGLTQTGAVMGTPSYMAPEQAEGKKDVGPPADIWALGVILYECLTGRPPFLAATIFDTLARVIGEEPVPPTRLLSTVPRDLETICLKCLHKSPEKRYPSAAALADDLARWRCDEPILARPAGATERVIKWARRRPTVAALAALSVAAGLALVGITAVALRQRQSAVDALERADRVQRERVLAQVNSLRDAAPGAVPALLAGLRDNGKEVLPRLRELYAAEKNRAGRMRLALALVSEDEDARAELAGWLRHADDPAEVLLARDALSPHADELTEGLWATARDGKARSGERFRALVALAAYDPESPRWKDAGAVGVEQLLSANPLHLGTWVQGLRPVRLALLGSLGEVLRGKNEAMAVQKQVAAEVLADYAADQPEVLADLLLDAEPRQYALLLPVLERHRERATRRIRSELSARPDDWQDGPPDPAWEQVPAELRRAVERASGLLADRWALCQALPAARLAEVTEGLRPCGYRPVRVRPWGQGDALRVAVVWARDGRAWRLETGLTDEQVKTRDAAHVAAGLIAEDAAGYETKDDFSNAVLWRKAEGGEKAAVYAGVLAFIHKARTDVYAADGMVPSTIQVLPGDIDRYAGVWWKKGKKPSNWARWWGTPPRLHADRVTAGKMLMLDVTVGDARPLIEPRLGWLADLEQAEARVRANPKDGEAVWARASALVHLGRDDEALADLDSAVERTPTSGRAYRERALLHARAGRAGSARSDLREYRKRVADGDALSEALVKFYLGNPGYSKRMEEAVRARPADPNLAHDAARVYAVASRWEQVRRLAWAAALAGSPNTLGLLAAPADRSGEYAGRALALLRQAHANGYDVRTHRGTDAGLEAIRHLPGYREVLAEAGELRAYSSVWRSDPTREASGLHGLTPEAHLERCRERAAAGWRPVALSVAMIAGEKAPVVASVWHRPVRANEREARARRQANASATLLRIGDAESAWPLFRHAADPTARSYLVESCFQRGVDARLLVRRLDQEKDVSARRALIVALGGYGATDLPADLRGPLVKKLLGWYRDDPDAGIHGAIDWLLRHGQEGPTARPLDWNQAEELARIDAELATKADLVPGPARGWHINGQGQTFTSIRGPVEFRMGSPPWEPGRISTESSHVRRIRRSFRIATKAVTVAQWRRYLKERPKVKVVSPNWTIPEQEGPVTSVTMYEAMAYCNWLSEAEGIPKEQWCYPENTGAGMKPFPDYLKRTGYRLPTEAEWEYACRAGSSSARYYGTPRDLLGRYAWYVSNSVERRWPVGQKRPNDNGLFDMHGNVSTWCQNRSLPYPSAGGEDEEDAFPVDENSSRAVRGGGTINGAPRLRSAHRAGELPSARTYYLGMRLCRTIP